MNTFYLVISIVVVVALAAWGLVKAMRVQLADLLIGTVAIIIGLVVGALLSVPLSRLPSPYGFILPIAATLVAVLVSARLFLSQKEAVAHLTAGLRPHPRQTKGVQAGQPNILVDTSVIIDGRIADIAQTGFVPGRLMVPRFVLAELQNIADSDDSMRRSRGRRGLEMLKTIQNTEGINLEITDDEVPGVKEVDAKLVALGKRIGASIMTTDYNLNRVAQIEGVRVLNINELSNAIRPVVLPGEEMIVKIVQAGKERNQGVGYLPDGTMIVVENGDKLIGTEIQVEVARVFQTVAGKMIFAAPVKQPSNGHNGQKNGRRNQPAKSHRNGFGERTESNRTEDIEARLVRDNQPK